VGMAQRTPFAALKELGYNGDSTIALLPPILLDPISSDLLLSCDREAGNDLLATYMNACRQAQVHRQHTACRAWTAAVGRQPGRGSDWPPPRSRPSLTFRTVVGRLYSQSCIYG
jgi:hypothetical protein